MKFLQFIIILLLSVSASDAETARRDKLSFSMERKEGVSKLNIDLPSDLRVEHFNLSDPPRLAIDIYGLVSKRGRSFPFPEDPAIQRLRLGAHNDRCRVVLDLHPSASADLKLANNRVQISVTGGDLNLESETQRLSAFVDLLDNTVASSDDEPRMAMLLVGPKLSTILERATTELPSFFTRSSSAPLFAPRLLHAAFDGPGNEKITSKIGAQPAPVLEQESPLPAKAELSIEIVDAEPPPPVLADDGIAVARGAITDENPGLYLEPSRVSTFDLSPEIQSMTAIIFKESGSEPRVEFSFSRPPNYEFVKSSDDSYKLRVAEASLAGSHLALPHFPPQNFPGLLFINPTKTSDGVEIAFGVEPGHKLSAYSQGSSVVVLGLQN